MNSPQQSHQRSASEFLEHALQGLQAALSDKRRHEARFVALATLADGDEARPSVRTVVLRQWEHTPPLWRFHSDRRAGKVREFSEHARVSAVFWDALNQLQIRIDGVARECTDAIVLKQAWDSLGKRAQQSFGRLEQPGTIIDGPDALTFVSGASDDSSVRQSTPDLNFMLIEVAVTQLDCLSLAHDPHHRVAATWIADGWCANWVAP